MFDALRISTKITLSVSAILAMLLLSSAFAFIYYETYEFEHAIDKSARNMVTVLQTVLSEAMLLRNDIGDDSPAIQTLNRSFEQLSKSTNDMTLWLVMGPKVLTFQEAVQSSEIKYPRDEIDREAIKTGLPVARMVGDDIYRYSQPLILGKGVASDPACLACHRQMGFKEGEVLGAFSVALDVKQRRKEYVATAWIAGLMAIIVSVAISVFTVYLLNRMAVDPVVRMTTTMGRLAKGDLQIDIPRGGPSDEIGEMSRAIEVFRENAVERKLAEDKIKSSLAEKEVLLQEVHHRVKNNLQVISSMLALQAKANQDENVAGALFDSERRIRVMAKVHENLYRSEDLARIDARNYLKSIVEDVKDSQLSENRRIVFNHDIDQIILGIDLAIVIGQIVSELVSNALKHAFPHGRPGTIDVVLKRLNGERIELSVADDGIGLPKDFIVAESKTLGLQLVDTLIMMIKGKLTISSSSGARFHIVFKAEGP
jgi:two-component sensor histidine kinase